MKTTKEAARPSSFVPRWVRFSFFLILLTSIVGFPLPPVAHSAEGNLQWAKQAGGTNWDFGTGIAVDGSGNSYVTGRFQGAATFGLGEVNETPLTAAGQDDIFVAKYDTSGALVWAKRAGGTGFDWGRSIAVDGLGNSHVTGDFSGTATFRTWGSE